MGVTVTVRGTAEAFHRPERATVHFRVAFDGPQQASVFASTRAAAAQIADEIASLHSPDDGPVTWWSTDQLHSWSEPGMGKDGSLPPVHHATVGFAVKFSDFDRLGSWLGTVGEYPGVRIERIEWALTRVREAQLVPDVRWRAVADARQRAQTYADAFGLGEVSVVAIAEPGLLPHAAHPEMTLMRASVASGSGQALEFVPQDVRLDAAIDVVFTAG
jgi:uncharacterized protein YggE